MNQSRRNNAGWAPSNQGRPQSGRPSGPGSRPPSGAGTYPQAQMPEAVEYKALRCQEMKSGINGTKVSLLSNFFLIKSIGLMVTQYDVDIKRAPREGGDSTAAATTEEPSPPASGRPRSTAFESFLKKVTPEILQQYIAANRDIFRDATGKEVPYVSDGARTLYTVGPLDLSAAPLIQKVTINGRSNELAIRLEQVAKVDLSKVNRYYAPKTKDAQVPMNDLIVCTNVANMVFRYIIEQSYTSQTGSFYNLADRRSCPTLKLYDFVAGFTSSVRMAEFGLAYNIHLKTTCLISNQYTLLLNFVLDAAKSPSLESLPSWKLRAISRLINQFRITTTHTPSERSYTVDSLVPATPFTHKFESDGKETTVAEYFQKTYNLTVQNLPLVRTTATIGNTKIVLPLEFCKLVPDQFVADTKFDKAVQTELLNRSKKAPNVYFGEVTTLAQNIAQINPDLLKGFGLELTTKPVALPGRVVPLPKILDGNRTLHKPIQTPSNWAVFSFDDSISKVEQIKDKFIQEARKLNLIFGPPKAVAKMSITRYEQIKTVFKRLFEQFKCEFALVIIPEEHTLGRENIYKLIKYYCNQEFEIINSCVVGETIHSKGDSIWGNILLKVNGKLGGQNTIVDGAYIRDITPLKMSETMVVGVDVNHPGAMEKVLSSVAAAVASYDVTMSSYTASIRVQRKERTETVHQIGSMMSELMEEYRKVNSVYPKNVFIFRDGVSEGQFKMVIEVELKGIQEALKKVCPKAAPKLTLVVSQKRHHTRFALTTLGSGFKPTYNVPSGTVVDTMIVEPNIEGFLLNSHYSQLGTSKSTKYIILRDDLNLSSDQIEKFCFYACHNCIRTRKTISIPTAVRYADLCAYRSKLHIEAHRILNDEDGASSSAGSTCGEARHRRDAASLAETAKREEEVIAQLNDWVKMKDKTKRSLYYA